MDDRAVFFSVVEANGFGAAARRLDTTPASVSRRVKALEQRLGKTLNYSEESHYIGALGAALAIGLLYRALCLPPPLAAASTIVPAGLAGLLLGDVGRADLLETFPPVVAILTELLGLEDLFD